MWQQAALPRPPLPVGRGHLGDTHWQGREMAAKETPRWTPPSLTHTHIHTYRYTHTNKTHPRLQGFAINPKAGEDYKGGGGGGGWRKEAMLSKCRNQGQDTEINLILKTKAHTSPIAYQSNLWYHSFCSSF